MTSNLILVDSNILVALFDRMDTKSGRSAKLWEVIESKRRFTLFPDCVVNETFSVIGRRLNEKGRKKEIKAAFERMEHSFKIDKIFWTYDYLKEMLPEIIRLLKDNNGIFSFHDALIALVMKKEGLKYILSFDQHFDLFPWIKRISEPRHLE